MSSSCASGEIFCDLAYAEAMREVWRFAAVPLEVMVRCGMWEEILAAPNEYPDYTPGTRAFQHAARAIALAAKGETEKARQEQAIYREKAKLVPKEEFLGNNPMESILAVVSPMVEGEISRRVGL